MLSQELDSDIHKLNGVEHLPETFAGEIRLSRSALFSGAAEIYDCSRGAALFKICLYRKGSSERTRSKKIVSAAVPCSPGHKLDMLGHSALLGKTGERIILPENAYYRFAFAELSAEVTHNHPEGIKGAKVVAGCIYLSRTGSDKEDIRKYVRQYYNINFTLDEIRSDYRFDVSCQGSVPQAIAAFLEGNDFIDVIAKAISIGGDSDTIAAIAGSIAETVYPIPYFFRSAVMDKLDNDLQQALNEAVSFCQNRLTEYK